jgi:hypothetical protein
MVRLRFMLMLLAEVLMQDCSNAFQTDGGSAM